MVQWFNLLYFVDILALREITVAFKNIQAYNNKKYFSK